MSANIKRMWINQPSNHQPHHELHGRHVLAVEEMAGVHKCYFTQGDVISMQIQSICLSDGWPAAGVELTDAEIEASVRSDRRPGTFFDRIDFARAVIAAHEAKKNGGGV